MLQFVGPLISCRYFFFVAPPVYNAALLSYGSISNYVFANFMSYGLTFSKLIKLPGSAKETAPISS